MQPYIESIYIYNMEKRTNFLEKPENIRMNDEYPECWTSIDKTNNYGWQNRMCWDTVAPAISYRTSSLDKAPDFDNIAIGLEALGFHMRITNLQDTRYEESDGIGDVDVMDGIGVEVTKKSEGMEDVVKLLYFVRHSSGAYWEGGGYVEYFLPKVLTDLQVFSDEILFAFNIGSGGLDPSGCQSEDDKMAYHEEWHELPREIKELSMEEGGWMPPSMYGQRYAQRDW